MVDYNDENYNYKSYWDTRSYEHSAEVIALKRLIPKNGGSILDVGAGFGRLFPVYKDRFKEKTLLEPSEKLLEQAKSNINGSNVSFALGEVPIRDNPRLGLSLIKYDCVLMVRVSHHLDNLDGAIASISKLVVDNGVIVFEFANKMHFLNVLKNAAKLNFGFFSKEPYKLGTFTLWHPEYIKESFERNGFRLEEKLSVSNFRNSLIKKIVPENILLLLEAVLQKPLSYINFGPSIFVKAVRGIDNGGLIV